MNQFEFEFKAHNLSINQLAEAVRIQADDLFPHRTASHMFVKLISEIGEFAEMRTPDEMADVLIMLLDYGAREGWDLETAVLDKMEINAARKWAEKDGVFRHV